MSLVAAAAHGLAGAVQRRAAAEDVIEECRGRFSASRHSEAGLFDPSHTKRSLSSQQNVTGRNEHAQPMTHMHARAELLSWHVKSALQQLPGASVEHPNLSSEMHCQGEGNGKGGQTRCAAGICAEA